MKAVVLVLLLLPSAVFAQDRSIWRTQALEKGVYTIRCDKKKDISGDVKLEGWFEIGEVHGKKKGELFEVEAKAWAEGKIEIKGESIDKSKDKYKGDYRIELDNIEGTGKHRVKLEANKVEISIDFYRSGTKATVSWGRNFSETGPCEVRREK